MVPVYRGKLLDSVFTVRTPALHQRLRKPVSSQFSMTSIKALEPFADECTQIFVHAMRELQGQKIDLGVWLQWYAFDVIGGMTFHKRFGFLEQQRDVESMITDIETGLPFAAVMGQIPESIPLVNATLQLVSLLCKPLGLSPPDPLRKIVKV